jgi:hypothetical protein
MLDEEEAVAVAVAEEEAPMPPILYPRKVSGRVCLSANKGRTGDVPLRERLCPAAARREGLEDAVPPLNDAL